MANTGGTGMMMLRSPNGKVLTFVIELGQFSSTMGSSIPYFEVSVKGFNVRFR